MIAMLASTFLRSTLNVIQAGVMSSFGFGQVGGTALVVHPRYLFGALELNFYEQYKERNRTRALQSYKAMSDMMVKNSLVKIKEYPPFTPENEQEVLMNSMAQLITSVSSHNPTFVAPNFTEAETAYCRAQPSPASSFAALWVGKEAVFKSLDVESAGAAAVLKDIEILNDDTGVPSVHLHSEAQVKAQERGVANVVIPLSHSETITIGFAQASYEKVKVSTFIFLCARASVAHSCSSTCVAVYGVTPA
ncbi:hypothetical protein AGABI2DRAFT_178019 [Agaricus bisporus var. bisporus H97]|uniref:hypothetical protein n=1 Tax=Agaricus bisporus var. bisporus (strain H97 / ATCC MYA-4626 / FGSC 10389) TaxID=936046 RepID=UPI00029F692E|nr:hypothetical protein AGABI2DRAFT_178019 [Agaricus bisporus var. bisporus H97]EKV48606.1 hypothetical protein AGABI2DRAFT_178019 [Agaricus bisporus var. bisporus H97]